MSKSFDQWALLILFTVVALALTALATAGSIEWPFLRGVVEAVAGFGLTEPFAALFAALAGWIARGRLRRRDRLSASMRRNSGYCRAQLMLTHEVGTNTYLLVRDYGATAITNLIHNSDVLDYMERKLRNGCYSTPALELDGPHGDVALASLLPFACDALMRGGPQEKEWCVVVPGYWEDPEDVDVLHLAVIPEADLRKYVDINFCFGLLVERPSHAPRILFMRDAARKHFEQGASPFARRELPVDRIWTPDRNCSRPCFDRPDLQEALLALGLALPRPNAEAVG